MNDRWQEVYDAQDWSVLLYQSGLHFNSYSWEVKETIWEKIVDDYTK